MEPEENTNGEIEVQDDSEKEAMEELSEMEDWFNGNGRL